MNKEFQEQAIQLADILDLDELEAARLLLAGQEAAESLDRSPLVTAVIFFHKKRHFLLECLYLVLKFSLDVDSDDIMRHTLQEVVALVLETKDGPARNGPLFTRKCVTAMASCEKWLLNLTEQTQRILTLGQAPSPEIDEIIVYQQRSLCQQHEVLAIIVTLLVKGRYSAVEDFHKVLDYMPTIDKWGSLAVHYVPILISCASEYGSPENGASYSEARSLNTRILGERDSRPWAILHLQAAFTTWWLAEYSGWFCDQSFGSSIEGTSPEAETQAQSEAFSQAIHDGAFQCNLSVASRTQPEDADDPVKLGSTRLLLQDTPVLQLDAALMSPAFREVLLENIEIFTISFITNMPDTLRRFKTEEDDQRRKLLSSMPDNFQDPISELDRNLERFLVTISYAFQGRSDASQFFWADTDSNLYGFLQWASRRQSTPGVAAFCEVLKAISEGEEYAAAAHRFLLEEGQSVPGRSRRSISLGWAQIFEEVEFYVSKTREHPVTISPLTHASSKPKFVDFREPESPLMLECYLRLISHLCFQSEDIRYWILGHPTFRIVDTLFALCSINIPARIRCCAYTVVQALLTNKSTNLRNKLWTALDLWVQDGPLQHSSHLRALKATNTAAWSEESTFSIISSEFEEANAFTRMLLALVSPCSDSTELNDCLPFPEQLGSSYRTQGITPYVDLVLGKIFAGLVPQLELENPVQSRVLASNALSFAVICLTSFNEDLLLIADRSTIVVDRSIMASSLSAYAIFHPFSRVIEWMFNGRVLAILFSISHYATDDVSNALPGSSIISTLLGCIEVMSLVLDLQSTYLDIVRPLIKKQAPKRGQSVLDPSLVSFEDSVSNNLQVVVDIGGYCGSGHPPLVLASLKLLEKLSMSRKLNLIVPSRLDSRLTGNRLVGALQKNCDLEPITRSLTLLMGFDERELAQGLDSPAYLIKSAILDLLNHTLTTSFQTPNLAHAFLGFECIGNTVGVSSHGAFFKGSSLFHAIVRLLAEYPDGAGDQFMAWSLDLKHKGFQILKALWFSPLTSMYTLSELRAGGFLFTQWISQVSINPDTRWNDLSIRAHDFFLGDSATALTLYTLQRCLLYEYACAEFRLVSLDEDTGLKTKIISTLLGLTSDGEGQRANLTLFDLLDFLRLDIVETETPPGLEYFKLVDFGIGADIGSDGSLLGYNIKTIKQLIALRYLVIQTPGVVLDAATDENFYSVAETIMMFFTTQNSKLRFQFARMMALSAWIDLATFVVQHHNAAASHKTALILQGLQIASSSMELYDVKENKQETLAFAKYTETLIAQLNNEAPFTENRQAGDMTDDRLFKLFNVIIRGIHNPDSDSTLRKALYHICCRYLIFTRDMSDATKRRCNVMQTMKAGGERLIDTICDDAYSGDGEVRITALMLLDGLSQLASKEESPYVVKSLVRTNFIVILVETIKDIPDELRGADPEGRFNRSPRYAV